MTHGAFFSLLHATGSNPASETSIKPMKKNYILNIGLQRNDGKGILPYYPVLQYIDMFHKVSNSCLRQSATEPTLILEIDNIEEEEVIEFVEHLCHALFQDCIAIRDENGNGELIGPKASEWGPFNPDYFLTFEEEKATV